MKYEQPVTCPFCGSKGVNFPLIGEWDYTYLHVNYLKCPSCNEKFRINWGEKEDGTKLVYTIPRQQS